MPFLPRFALAVALAALVPGCSSSPPPRSAEPPSQASAPPEFSPPPAADDTGFSGIVSGAADSVGAAVGSPDAMFKFRFKQIDPASDRFTFRDRDLSFYFKPSPDALHFQVENLKQYPVWIDWDRSTFLDPNDQSGKLAHASTRWRDRYSAQPSTQIPGLQRYGDYALPLEYLFDPAGSDQQLHRPLLPEDTSAPQYSERVFGMDLVVRVEDRPRTYSFRFKVASVIPIQR